MQIVDFVGEVELHKLIVIGSLQLVKGVHIIVEADVEIARNLVDEEGASEFATGLVSNVCDDLVHAGFLIGGRIVLVSLPC